jgi:hypothetical protein
MSWHIDEGSLRGYEAKALTAAKNASVESHLAGCATCRATFGSIANPQRVDRNWAAIASRIDERSSSIAERALTRLGIREHHARLVVMMPAMRSPSFIGLVAVLAMVAAVSGANGARDNLFYAFVVVAPLLPIAGVAAAFGSTDPVRELTAATPIPPFELLLVRTLAVVAISTGFTLVFAVPLAPGWPSAAWLLPALGLTAAALAMATWVPAHSAAAALGIAWVAAAAVSWRANRLDPDVLYRFVALRPAGQLAFAAVTAAGVAVFVLRRGSLDLRRFA